MDLRPAQNFASPTGDAGLGAAAGANEAASHLASPFEAQFSGTDIARAHQFFQPATVSQALAGIDVSVGLKAPLAPLSGMEAAMVPGSDSVLATALAGANEPISPVIQLIMRMP